MAVRACVELSKSARCRPNRPVNMGFLWEILLEQIEDNSFFSFFLNKEFSLLPYKHNSVTSGISGSINIFFIIKIKKIMIPMNFCYYIEEQKNILISLIFAEQSYLIKS